MDLTEVPSCNTPSPPIETLHEDATRLSDEDVKWNDEDVPRDDTEYAAWELAADAEYERYIEIQTARWKSGGIVSSIDLAAIMRELEAAAQVLWGPFLHKGSIVLLNAESGTGKTVLCKRLAHALATDTPSFLGMPTPNKCRVLYVELESPAFVLKRHTSIIPSALGLDFVRVQEAELLKCLSKEAMNYDVVFVDPLMLAIPVTDEDDNALANAQMKHFEDLKTAYGTTFILIHNIGLAGGRGRGATSRKDRCDFQWLYTKEGERSEGRRKLVLDKDRGYNNFETIHLEFTGELDYRVIEDKKPLGDRILVWKRQHPGLQAKSVIRAAVGEPAKTTFNEAVRKLTEGGYLTATDDGIGDGPTLHTTREAA